MSQSLNQQNKSFWQKYQPGKIPSSSNNPPDELLNSIHGPILDVGTGDGNLAEALARKGHETYGIDIAENIITENKKRKTKVNYSVQDITERTNFPDGFFALLIFRFTLTNIHKESWDKLAKEIFRILKPSGKVWILEPLVSESYKQRYQLASNFIDDRHCVYVFRDKDMAEKINTKEELAQAIEEKKVSRIVKHYTVEELQCVFKGLVFEKQRTVVIPSPSGYPINTFEGIFSKHM
ncbi:MAG: class I SAM-dependent methyltransferase [Patescibacteria group bacterium]|jgi:ubiquinone/menaquinone biosynthesis C-methylase UbiE